MKIAIQYPSFGPQHPPRLKAIYDARPTKYDSVFAMEMFKKDSDYEWRPVEGSFQTFTRYTVMPCTSVEGRSNPVELRRGVLRALGEIRPDVLVVNGWGHRESRISLTWCRKMDCPIVLLSDSPKYNFRRTFLKELYKKWLLRDVKVGFVAGTPQAEYLEDLGVPREGIFYPGSCVVDNDYWANAVRGIRSNAAACRARYNLPEKFFLSVSRFIPCKNVTGLVRAFGRYRRAAQTESWDLVLCGSGPEEEQIRSLIARERIGGVHFAGFRQVDELPVYYALASCFILASIDFECWGLVVNEAMASGLPVLISNMVGASRDLVREGKNGYTFNPASQEEISDAMYKMNFTSDLSAMKQESLKIIEGHRLEVGAEMLWKAVRAANGKDVSLVSTRMV